MDEVMATAGMAVTDALKATSRSIGIGASAEVKAGAK